MTKQHCAATFLHLLNLEPKGTSSASPGLLGRTRGAQKMQPTRAITLALLLLLGVTAKAQEGSAAEASAYHPAFPDSRMVISTISRQTSMGTVCSSPERRMTRFSFSTPPRTSSFIPSRNRKRRTPFFTAAISRNSSWLRGTPRRSRSTTRQLQAGQ